MRIRAARADEWALWRDLRLRALEDSPDAFCQRYGEAARRPEAAWRDAVAPRANRICLLAERDEVAIGMAVATIAGDDDGPRRANLFAMWVAPDARRTGIARALVDAATRWARFAGARTLALQVTEGNAAARAMYLAAGFTDTGTTEPIDADARDPESTRDPGSARRAHVLVAALGPLVMGVVNVTPDSFSERGAHADPGAAIDHALSLVRDGADIVDVGGEATNPRATPVDAAQELRRVLPVIEALARRGTTISVDTTKAEVARAAVQAGATIVNDVSGGLFDPAMAETLAALDVTYIAGHLRGRTLAEVFAAEGGVPWREVAQELGERLAGLAPRTRARAWVDPGLGFGKGADPEGNLHLIRRAGELAAALGCPVVVGPSRKRFLRRLVGGTPGTAALDAATVAACLGAVRAGAHVLRVHNVALLRAALAVYTRL